MTSPSCGAAVEIRKEAQFSLHCICASHSLNLSLSKSSGVQIIRNSMGTIQQVASFFRCSAKRHYVLSSVLRDQPNSSKQSILSLCETRWVERHNSVLQFRDSLEIIVHALEIITSWDDRDTSSKAKTLLSAVTDPEFIVAICSISDPFIVTMPLSKALQTEGLDLIEAGRHVNRIIDVLQRKRDNAETTFSKIYSQSESMAENLGMNITMPRISLRQKIEQILLLKLLNNIIEESCIFLCLTILTLI